MCVLNISVVARFMDVCFVFIEYSGICKAVLMLYG